MTDTTKTEQATTEIVIKPVFQLGAVVCTAGVDRHARDNNLTTADLLLLLGRHAHGDWGDVCDEDREINRVALAEGFRLMSVYGDALAGKTLWIITEADRSVTTLLFPEEY